jgi:prefoldin subunit 5
MTPKARNLFYQQEPEIVPKHSFQKRCLKTNHALEKAIILGCYSSNGYKSSIAIQAVSDDRLKGTMEATAAHEMLHAAYHRLSQVERSWLAPRLKAAKQWVEEPNLLALLKKYEAGDPDTYLNELHSHLGVELADLKDPELEKYYQKYFIDRQQVVALAQQSQSTLNQLEAQAKQLKPELDALEASLKEESSLIQAISSDLKNRTQNLEQMKFDLMNLKQRAEESLRLGEPSLAIEFDRAKSRYNAEVDDYNLQLQTHQERVDRFNQQVERYQEKVNTYNQLVKTGRSILSTLEIDRSVDALPQASP